MRRTTLREQHENYVHLEDGAAKFPVVINVNPGEDPGVGYPGDDLHAPLDPGTYTLWHVVENSTHLFWWWEKEPMVFIARKTLKNAYDQVLFREGYKYYATDEDSKRFFLFNELHSETPVRKSKVNDDFIVEE